MMGAVETPCVWIITDRSIFGITVEKLMRLGKDAHKIQWNSLPSVPSLFDFSLDDLPEFAPIPLLYDSNIFLAYYSGEIYHLQFHDTTNKEKQLYVSKVPPESIPFPPVSEFCKPLFANIGGKLYFLAFDSEKWMRKEPLQEGFWVLDPAIGDWRSLDFPIPIGDENYDSACSFVVINNKIYFDPWFIPERKYHEYSFDCQTEKWKKVGLDSERVFDFPPVVNRPISLALPPHHRDLMVAVTWRDYRVGEEGSVVKLCAVLLDSSKGYSIVFHQQLDELYEGFHEDLHLDGYLEVEILDLGNGLVCALVGGNRYDLPRSYLWVIVFSLSWTMIPLLYDARQGEEWKQGKFLDFGKQGKFLDVELHSNRLLFFPYVSGYGYCDNLHHAFLTNYATPHGFNNVSEPKNHLELKTEKKKNNKPLPAEVSRTIMELATVGTLAGLTGVERYPFGVSVRFAVDPEDGTPFFCLNPKVSFLPLTLSSLSSLHVQLNQSGLRTPQCTLRGTLTKPHDANTIKRFVSLWRKRFGEEVDQDLIYIVSVDRVLQLEDFHEDGKWISPFDYRNAQPDPLREFAGKLVNDMNTNNMEDIARLCNIYVDLDFKVLEAKMIWVDRLGFDVRVSSTQNGIFEVRIPFPREVTDEKGAKSTFNCMSKLAWEVERNNFHPPDFEKVKQLKHIKSNLI